MAINNVIGKASCPAAVLGAVLALGGCATTSGPAETTAAAQPSPADPYENINRKIFAFNDKVDTYVAKPVADAYKWVTPQFFQTGVSNFFNNLKSINVVLNDLLQAKFEQGAQDTGRFLINTTAGLGGLIDVAKHAGLEQNDEDFEQTLAVWGVPQGSYLVLPFLGPSTARGIPGSVFDTATNPATYVGLLPVQAVSMVSMVNARANAEGALKFIDEAALDPYVFTRESFLQWRQNLATDGKSEAKNDLSNLEADLLDEDEKAADAAKPKADAVAPADPAPAKAVETPAATDNKQADAMEEKAAEVQPAAVVPATQAPAVAAPQSDAFREAKRKYEMAKFEYLLEKRAKVKKKARRR